MALKLHNATPAANTALVITIAPQSSNQSVEISNLHCGYAGTPTGGLITVANVNGSYIMPITAQGTIARDFSDPIRGDVGATVTVTLAAGGVGVTGYLSVGEHQ